MADQRSGAFSALIGDLVTANHILADRGVVDGFGHVSVRSPERSDAFLIARSMAPALVSSADILTLDLDGVEVTGDPRPSYVERFIHAEIYRVRPDASAIVHSHSPAIVPFSVAKGVALKPIYHMCGFMGVGTPVYEIRDDAGDATDMLIRTPALGASLSRCLAENAAVLMRGHGSTTVGDSLKQVVFRAVYLELNAKLQAEAIRLGDVTYLTAQEAAAAAATNDQHIDRAWQFWRRELALKTGSKDETV